MHGWHKRDMPTFSGCHGVALVEVHLTSISFDDELLGGVARAIGGGTS